MVDLDKLRKTITDDYDLITSGDGTELFLRSWKAESIADISILILHGITAHGGIYSDIGKELAERGFNTFALDLRGHGLSGGSRGDSENSALLMDDFTRVFKFLRTDHFSVVLFGHSMGVTTTLKMLKHEPESIDGLILYSGQIRIPEMMIPDLNVWKKIKIWFAGKFTPSKPILNFDQVREIADTDEYYTFDYTMRFFEHLEVGILELPKKIEQPVYVLVGEEDELWDVDEIRSFCKQLPAEDKRFESITGERHASLSRRIVEDTGIEEWLTTKIF